MLTLWIFCDPKFQEMSNLREAKSSLARQVSQLEMQLESRSQTESIHLKEITKLRNQLKEENRVKIVSYYSIMTSRAS